MDYYEDKISLLSKYADKIDYVLDVGCGSGVFLQAVQLAIDIDKIIGVDLSEEMIKKSLFHHDSSENISLLNCDVLRLPLKGSSFNLIYVESLLHHLVGETRAQSKNQARMAIKGMSDLLRPNGFLLLTELFYESYGFSTFTSSIIFTFLSLFDKYNVSPPLKEAPKGLIVSFYTRKELYEMIESLNGTIVEEQEIEWGRGFKEKAVLLKKRGKITYLIQFSNIK